VTGRFALHSRTRIIDFQPHSWFSIPAASQTGQRRNPAWSFRDDYGTL
jgi:hypothetical protein